MRIVKRSEFLPMPPGTLYSKYEPHFFGPLCIKGDTLGNDFLVQDIHDAVDAYSSDEMYDRLDAAREEGASVSMDFYAEGRDGCLDSNQLFAVWEAADVRALVARLQEAIAEGYA